MKTTRKELRHFAARRYTHCRRDATHAEKRHTDQFLADIRETTHAEKRHTDEFLADIRTALHSPYTPFSPSCPMTNWCSCRKDTLHVLLIIIGDHVEKKRFMLDK